MDSRLEALRRASERLPPGSAFSGLTAAWLLGLDVDPCSPIEATAPPAARVSTRSGMRLRRSFMDERDVVVAKGLHATSVQRTLLDLCLSLSLTEAVVIADMALHARRITISALAKLVEDRAGRYGVPTLRRVVQHAEPKSESPMETRMRMVIVRGRLPRPEAQVPIYDGTEFVARPDLHYREQRLRLEYDGSTHKDSVAEDNRRQNLLLGAGVRLLRFTPATSTTPPTWWCAKFAQRCELAS